MKSLGLGILHLALLSLLFACGKENESGKSNNQWGIDAYGNPVGVTSPYAYQGMDVNQVIQQNPCISGYGGYNGYNNTAYAGQRIPITIPLTNFPTVISPGDIYVGVTSYGDVAVVAGQGANQPPLFVGYMCPRSFAPNGQGQLLGVKIGAYSQCLFKPITAATVVFPGGGQALFRWADAGTSTNQPFSFCRR